MAWPELNNQVLLVATKPTFPRSALGVVVVRRPWLPHDPCSNDNCVMPDLNAETAKAAIKRLLLTCISPAMAAETEGINRTSERIRTCIERVKVEASEGASLVAECAPHGRAMVAKAQQTLADLEALSVLDELAGEMFGAD